MAPMGFRIFETTSYSFDVGSTVEVFIAENETFTGLFFQDAEMKTNFASFSELLMVDATYKLYELRMPLYLLLVVDGNGQSEIVGSFLTAIETKEAITKIPNLPFFITSFPPPLLSFAFFTP